MIDRPRRMPPPPHAHEEATEPGRYGCPVLVPVQWGRASEACVPTSRCLIGWSLTDDLDIARCRATHAVVDCWKAHPERTPLIVADDAPTILTVYQVAAAD